MPAFFKYFFFGCIFFSLPLLSQNEAKKWYFGDTIGLDFMTNPPTALTNGAMDAVLSCASIADANGNLLFYTDGATIYNAGHTIMSNGSGLSGSSFNPQGTLIIKKPASNTLYYVFTTDYCPGGSCTGGIRYSIVDMSLSSGSGSVVSLNTPLYSGSINKITGTKHCDGSSFWIVAEEELPLNSPGNWCNFLSFSLTASGINTTAVVSSGATYTFSVNNVSWGAIKISPNGKHLGTTIFESVDEIYMVVGAPSYELYDFDISTGIVSNPLSLSVTAIYAQYAYGCEFSPDGSKFYGTGLNGGSLFQWDVCAGSPSAIIASKYEVMTTLSWGNIQLAPDGKIYINHGNSVDIINNPNAGGSACNYSMGALYLSATNHPSFPNFVSSSFLQHPVTNPFTYTASNSYGCQTAQFNANNLPGTIIGCTASNYTLNSLQWIFGDPASGANNTSTLQSPMHAFTTLGTYNVKLVLHYSCGGGTDTITQAVVINQPCISINSTSITCANLGTATVTPTGGLGPFSYTWMPTGQSGSVATGLNPGTHTLTVFDSGLNFTYTTSTFFTSLIPLTGNINKSTSVTCHGASTATANVTNVAGGSGNQTYLWINPSGQSYTNASVGSLSAGLWSVTVTDVLTACEINQSFYITEPAPLILSLSSSSGTACVNDSVVLTGTNSGGIPQYTYSWTTSSGNATETVSEGSGGNYIYTLTSSDSNNCLASNTIAVTFIQNPTLTISNASICPFAVGVITVSGASTYLWSDNSTGNSLTASPLVNTQYTVTGTNLGCSSSIVASILLKPVPPIVISSNSPRCFGDNLSLICSGGSNFLWAGPNNFTSTVQLPLLSNVSLNSAGVYSLLVTGANSCTNSSIHTVIVHPSPTLSATGSTVCTTQTLNLFVSTNATAFAWNGPQNFTSSSQNPSINSPVLLNTGTYTVKVTSAQGCTNSAFVLASVIPPPSLTGSLSSNGTLCAQALNGSPNTITLTSGGANTYTLFTPYHISNQNAAGPSYSMSSLPPYNTGPATATLMGSNGVCSASLAINFSVIPNPTLSPLTPTPVICSGETFTYTSNGANSYTWGPNSPNLTTYTGPATVASPTQTSIYSVVGGSLGCYSGTQTSTITVRPLPQLSINPTKPEICLNESVILNSIGNAESYTWSPHFGLSSVNGLTVSASPISQQTYTVLGVLNTCTSTAMITVSVLPLPVPVASVLSDKLCVNGLVSLQGSGGLTYNWEGPLDIKLAGQTATFVANSVNYSGTYILTVTDTNGCKNKTSTDLTIYNLPGGTLLTTKKESCVPFIAEFKSSVTSMNVISNWTLENRNYTTAIFSHQFVIPGTYTIKGNFRDTLTTCISSNSFIVKANPNPIADFNISPEKPIENLDEVIFTNTSIGEQQTKWNWYFDNNQGYQSQNKNTSYLFNHAGIYPVAMVVTNAWGCRDTIIKTIKVEADLAVYVPNIFTPNGDDLNDIFTPVARAIKNYELTIFDRWGAAVFSTTDLAKGWDGTFRGEECKVDVYVWKINLSSVNGEMKTLTGHVTLSR